MHLVTSYTCLMDQFLQIFEASWCQGFLLGRGHLDICTEYISVLASHFIFLDVLIFPWPPHFFLIYLFLLFVFMIYCQHISLVFYLLNKMVLSEFHVYLNFVTLNVWSMLFRLFCIYCLFLSLPTKYINVCRSLNCKAALSPQRCQDWWWNSLFLHDKSKYPQSKD